MRVVGGDLGGRRLRTPVGAETRPTSDLVRGALFDALEARRGGLGGLRTLDLFAGSGALGIEALSRGAAEAWFVERSPAALAVLRGNVETLGLGPRVRVLAADVRRALGGGALRDVRFGLVLADPPYAQGVSALLPAVATAPWLLRDGLCAFEHAAREELPVRSGTLGRVWHRAYGGTAVSVYAPNPET